jgi:hypothetical protein
MMPLHIGNTATRNSLGMAERDQAGTEAAAAAIRVIQATATEEATEADREAGREAALVEAPAAAAITREGEAVLSSGKNISIKTSHTV